MIETEREFKAGAHQYRAGRIDTFEQMNMASEFREALMGLALLKKERTQEISEQDYAKAIEFVVTGGAGRVAPEVRERVMRRCFRVVTRRETNGWAPVMNADGGLQTSLSLSDSVVIMYNVFDHNGLLDFFSVGPSTMDGPQEETSSRRPSRTARTGS